MLSVVRVFGEEGLVDLQMGILRFDHENVVMGPQFNPEIRIIINYYESNDSGHK